MKAVVLAAGAAALAGLALFAHPWTRLTMECLGCATGGRVEVPVGAARGDFHHGARVAAAIERYLNRPKAGWSPSSPTLCGYQGFGTIACYSAGVADGRRVTIAWHYSYQGRQRAWAAERVESRSGDVLGDQAAVVSPSRYGLSSF